MMPTAEEMSRIKKVLLFLAVALVCTIGYCVYRYAAEGFTSASYQHDADIVRLQDVNTIGGWLEEYARKEGKYPFMGEGTVPIYVHVASAEQYEYAQEGPPFPHTMRSTRELTTELERGLSRSIAMPFDPQRAPVNKPNFYVYAVDGDTYNFAVHLHEPNSFARKIGPHYYKLEISNRPNPDLNIWAYEDLMANPYYKGAAGRTSHKPGFMEEVRGEFR